MLLQFSVGNHRSFRERQTLSFVASKDTEHLDHTFDTGVEGLRALKSVALYGANASGKSNVVSALALMKQLVIGSAKDSQRDERIPVQPFRLDPATEGAPSEFEVVIVLDGARYVYGFTVDADRVHEEWLTVARKVSKRVGTRMLFSRIDDEIEFGDSWGSSGALLQQHTRPNALVLSTAVMLKVEPSPVYDWFFTDLRLIHDDADPLYGLARSFERAEVDAGFRATLEGLVRAADFGIATVKVVEVPFEYQDYRSLLGRLPDDTVEYLRRENREGASRPPLLMRRPYTTHHAADGRDVEFDPVREESLGTVKLLSFASQWYDLLRWGKTLVVDELEARLHPLLAERLLHDAHQQPGEHQLLFTTHDASLMERASMRRDQVWFVEKRAAGASNLYSLWDFRPRKGLSATLAYLQGRFGAVPLVGNLGLGTS